jgi:phosphopantetheine--protein transferase-like protein
MKVGTGVDIIDIREILSTLNDPVQLARMLYPGDINRSEPEHIAGRIALKEAAIKALGLKPGDWLSIKIQTASTGKPIVIVTDSPTGLASIDGSVSHHGDIVVGFVVALFNDKND